LIEAGQIMAGVFEVSRSVPISVAIDDILLIAECSLEEVKCVICHCNKFEGLLMKLKEVERIIWILKTVLFAMTTYLLIYGTVIFTIKAWFEPSRHIEIF
jgi:hypothetical protein